MFFHRSIYQCRSFFNITSTGLLLLTLACSQADFSAARFRHSNSGVTIEDSLLCLRFDAHLYAQASLQTPRGTFATIMGEHATDNAVPPQYIKVNGEILKDFGIDAKGFHSLTNIDSAHGRGKKLQIWGVAPLASGGSLKKTVTVEIYEKYPGTALFRTTYTNLGSAPVTVNTVYETMWRLNSAGLWALHPRNWIWGEDFLFPVEPGLQLSGANFVRRPGKAGPISTGGGLPAVSLLAPQTTVTLGYLSSKLKIVRFPLREESGAVTVGVERDIGLGAERSSISPGATFESIPTFLSLHSGDFYEGVRIMSRLLHDEGLRYANPSIEHLTAPAWSNRGNRDAWSKQYILDMLPLLRKYGIKWIHVGDPWQNNLGDYGPGLKFADAEDLREFIAHLHQQGFGVTAFMSDLFVDPVARAAKEHPDYFVQGENGKALISTGFAKNYLMLCPSYAPAREFMRQVSVKLARDFGFDGVKNDGNSLPPPCYNAVHKHPYPEQSTEDYYLLNQVVYDTFAELKPKSFVGAFCFDGVVPYLGHLLYTSRPWPNADQTSEWQARLKQKLFKAILGPQRTLLDDHSDAKYLTGRRGTWFLGPVSGLAMGSVLETVINQDYDYRGHHYDEIFAAYHRERLPEGGEYLNLYNMIHERPEGHVVRKSGKLYYGFFTKRFEGDLELRGLENGKRYQVIDYLHGSTYPEVLAKGLTAVLKNVQFDEYLLLKLEKR
ncbi:MAG: hypothetical protein L0387_03135 [Acidobacteria bacterium]|nr:hypothetical protein [Acidobacteriota bacterium]